MKKALLTGITALLLATGTIANAATFTPTMCNDFHCIRINGEIEYGDEAQFLSLRPPAGQTYVYFNSKGGNLESGLKIASAIRILRLETVVADDTVCASVCGLMWLAGSKRWISSTAMVGFHSAYDEKDRPSQFGNKVIVAFLTELGLSDYAAGVLTAANPHSMYWLTGDRAKQLGIDAIVIQKRKTCEEFYSQTPASSGHPIEGWICVPKSK
jgi:hypothetical protein